jgi:hypothetical protein
MYQYLSDYGNKNVKTSDKKFACTNYIDPNTQNFYNYYNLPSTQNTEIEQVPFYKVSPQNKIKNEQVLKNDGPIKEEYETGKKQDSSCFVNQVQPKSIYHVEEVINNSNNSNNNNNSNNSNNSNNNDKDTSFRNISPTSEPEQQLLPVLDANFNMREICKQCILLEDHLSHVEKRCPDCCIKHFLALEALSEEAIQLDKEQKLDKNVKDLPTRIRGIQKRWYQNPSHNATQCSQDLRKIRKLLMENSFPIVFNEDKNKSMSCSATKCMLK